jgi:hypothetical protein
MQHGKLNTGFASLSDLITEATTGGKSQVLPYQKTGVAGPAATSSAFLWAQGAMPSAGANAAAAPGGTIPDNTTNGGFKQVDPAGSDTLHLTTWTGLPATMGRLMTVRRSSSTATRKGSAAAMSQRGLDNDPSSLTTTRPPK